MTDIRFVDRMDVQYIQHMGPDTMICNAARASTTQKFITELGPRDEGLIRRVVGDGHTSTLEHSVLTVRADVTLDVRSEWHRHRTQSYNEVSGRYSEYSPRFYIEPADRPLGQTGKSMDYQRSHLSTVAIARHRDRARLSTAVAWDAYQAELADDVCREVARRRLPSNLMTQFYATANLSNWFKYLGLRNKPDALHEIRDAAEQVESIISELWPVAFAEFDKQRDEWARFKEWQIA
ncbi:FAD-dependent thymidylate synthase [Brevibacterium sp. CSND-B09]|uniref:FAD-dependent thymidylate synthase n=1 Tax=Brevibacterium sp. CSND-B09 TaxID=3462571 RepID=UPI00406A5F95